MQLILTHESADFDALASLVAAHMLEPASHAALPHRINRNVRAFLNLSGDELPLEDQEDLPKERVDRITLVDTQGLPTLRGSTTTIPVHVVDHHPANHPLPASWTAVIEIVGATTTLLVEMLRDQSRSLTRTEATLFLLGILEDTGSFSYAGTTARDLQSAAWLLEQGASLTLASDFLNPPLSASQRILYDRLLESVECLEINGQQILLAQAEAPADIEEVAILAHKLRDVFDPDGLFMIVDLGSRLQLVARSTSDSVDVGLLAAQFGGGGHSRAAAAIFREKTLSDARAEVLAALPACITPPLRVEQMYSARPQIVETGLTVADAAERMTRYGYEGFPVVQDGKVVGLLTRRAVDRALAHGMHHSMIDSVMEAGNYSVLPSDSVSHLQRQMIDCGWGQMPVIAPEDGRVIGIVTRTDLLKALTPAPATAQIDLKQKILNSFPPERIALIRVLSETADSLHLPIYLVGGVVRDLILGIPSVDLDIVIEGDAIALARLVVQQYGGRLRGHDRFGTAKWLLEGVNRTALGIPESAGPLPESLDLVTSRAEFYPHPSALPEVERGNLKLDLHRRDFTINTMALSLNASHFGKVHDYWGGMRDLEEKRIRVLHSLSFIDDPTRILRGARLEQRLGFSLEPRTRDLIITALPLLHRVSGDRIRHELESIFEEPDPSSILTRLQELSVLSHIHPALHWDAERSQRLDAARTFLPDPRWRLACHGPDCFLPISVWLLGHPESVLASVLTRLNYPRREAEKMLTARRVIYTLTALKQFTPPSRIAGILDDVPVESLAAAWLETEGPVRDLLGRYLSEWRGKQPITDGAALQARGLQPGPLYRKILRTLRDAWLDGQITSAEEEALALDQLLILPPS